MGTRGSQDCWFIGSGKDWEDFGVYLANFAAFPRGFTFYPGLCAGIPSSLSLPIGFLLGHFVVGFTYLLGVEAFS